MSCPVAPSHPVFSEVWKNPRLLAASETFLAAWYSFKAENNCNPAALPANWAGDSIPAARLATKCCAP
jgi:hypothetical protein